MKQVFKHTTLISLFSIFLLAACAQKQKNIGLQLYSFRDDIQKSGIEKVLDEVANIGYTRLEIAAYNDGLFYGYTPKAFKELAESKGLTIVGSSAVRYMTNNPQADFEFWDKAIKAHVELGVKYLIMPAPPFNKKDTTSLEDVEKVCDYFNKIGAKATAAGLRFGFHNHNHEFIKTINGQPVYDIMLSKLDPKNVFMEMDVYWVQKAGYSPVEYMEKYKNRFPLLHIKDETAVGASGTIDFKSIFETAYNTGMETYFVEVEWYATTPFEDIKKSFDYLNNAPFVQ